MQADVMTEIPEGQRKWIISCFDFVYIVKMNKINACHRFKKDQR
jgi:hypothetical protein